MHITAHLLKDLLTSQTEFALLDVRERGPFSQQHILLSSCVPLGHLEMMIADLVPRKATRIIVTGDGPLDEHNVDERAALRLRELGYEDVSVLEGGINAWREAGFELFSGVGSYSKAFGEWIVEQYRSPSESAQQIHDRVRGGEKLILLDCRPQSEYHCMTIPGSINAPGADLIYRVHDVVPDPETLVVVHCAGRTRSIIGSQSLINAGIPNPVTALENGTMGWQLAGLDLEYGQTRFAPLPSSQGIDKAKECAARIADRFGIRKVPFATIESWLAATEARTTCLIDVRLPEEFGTGHLKGSRNIQGGQLVQATDEYIAVHNARIVLVDDTEVRATITASWLVQMGWTDVYVLEGGIGNLPLTRDPSRSLEPGFEKAVSVDPKELQELLKVLKEIVMLDLSASTFFKKNHISRAWWGIRSRIPSDLDRLPSFKTLVLTSEDGILAHLAATDLKRLKPELKVFVLEGGTNAWMEAGLPTSGGMENAISQEDDTWYMPYMFPDAPEQAKREYLEWELALVAQVERDGTARFRKF